jgi:hypothetical protein
MSAPIRFARSAELPVLTEEFVARGLALFTLDGSSVTDRAALLAALGRSLGFPAYFGGNWDALEESLGDLAARLPQGGALLCHGASSLWQNLPRDMGMLVSVWLAAAEAAAGSGKRLELVFLLPD